LVSVSIIGRAASLLRAQVANDPSVIIGPIARVFGYIIDFIFNIVYSLTENHSLGVSIIFLTIIVRFLMLPMGIKQQKSMIKMQKLNPELQKLRAKYGNSKDPEIVKKMNAEQQALYAKNKVNPLGGCLPLLVTMPLFFGLSYIMNQSYLYVNKLNETYHELSYAIMDVPLYTHYVVPLAEPHVPKKMLDERKLDISRAADMSKVINKFTAEDWENLLERSPLDYTNVAATLSMERDKLPPINTMRAKYDRIINVLEQKRAIENFFGIPLIDASGWSWPGLLIPIFVALSTFSSSWIMQRTQVTTDEKQKTQQKIMLYAMPVLMLFMTGGLAAGVGVYWITSSIFQTGQSAVLNARSGFPVFKKKEA